MGEGDEVAAVEAALVGFADRDAINLWLDQVLRHLLGVGLARVDFVAGRIDAAYGVTTDGGLQLLIKVHRPPVDVTRAGSPVRRAQPATRDSSGLLEHCLHCPLRRDPTCLDRAAPWFRPRPTHQPRERLPRSRLVTLSDPATCTNSPSRRA
jgi:hypothetical protein